MNYLFNENPLVVDRELAVVIGLNEAMVLQQMQYWLKKSDHIHENKAWIYNSVSQWKEQFSFFSESTINRAIKTLETKGLLFIGYFNRDKRDRTRWYSINYEELNAVMNNAKVKMNNAKVKMNNAKVKMTDAFSQNDQMHLVKMNNAIYIKPETTTETTTEKEKVEKEILEETDAQTHPTPTLDVSTEDSVKIPYREIVESYHRNLPTLPKVFEFTDKRKAGIRRIWTKEKRSRSMSWWDKYFQYASRSSFLMGSNQRGWRANFDFLINYSNHIKLVEGGYHKEEE